MVDTIIKLQNIIDNGILNTAIGKITLADLREYFWYTYKDEYRLGLISYAEYSKHGY